MTEEAVTEAPEQTEAQAEADFNAGFDKAPGVTPVPEAKTEEKTAEKSAETTEPAAQAETPEAKPTLIAGMTEEQLKTALGKGAAWEAEVRKVYSKVGELNRTIQDLQKSLAAGTKSPRKITAELLKRVNEELPGLGEALAADLTDILGAPAVAEAKEAAEAKGESFDPEKFFAERVGPALEQFKAQANEEAQTDLLEFMHPGYEETLKAPEFKTWLQTLSAERQKEVVDSPKAIVAGRAISEFKEWNAKQAKEKEKTTKRLEGAITPKGAAQPGGPTVKDEDALFNQGFNEAGKKYAR